MKRFKIGEEVKIGNVTGIIVSKKQESNGLWYKIKYSNSESFTYARNKEIKKLTE